MSNQNLLDLVDVTVKEEEDVEDPLFEWIRPFQMMTPMENLICKLQKEAQKLVIEVDRVMVKEVRFNSFQLQEGSVLMKRLLTTVYLDAEF